MGCDASYNPWPRTPKFRDVIREWIEREEVNLKYVSTKDMLADSFSNAWPKEAFAKFRNALGV